MISRRMTTALATTTLLAALLAAPPMAGLPAAAPADGQERADAPEEVFAMLDQLAALPRFGTADVVRLTQIALTEAQSSNRYFRIYTGAGPKGPIAGVELRVAQPGAAASAGDILILTLAAPVTIGVDALTSRYGQVVSLNPPRPTAPDDAPVYYRYRLGQRIVSFGMSRATPMRATMVVIDLGRK